MNTKKMVISILLFFAIVTVHGALADNSCLNCHEKLSAFSEKQKELNEIRIKHLARDVSCSLECHADILDKIAKSNYQQWTKSKHAMFNVTCDRCHGGNSSADIKEDAHTGVRRASDSNSSVFYRNVPETCGKCHIEQLNQFKKSEHYQKLKALEQAPTCDTCHLPHGFKVLNISEFHTLCDNCHNINMGIAPSDAPDEAISALEQAENLKNEIEKADSAIKLAEKQGKDVSEARNDLKKAISIRDRLPVQWHSFDLPPFKDLIKDGIKAAQQAQLDTGKPVATPSTPGFGVLLSLAGIVAVYLMRRKGE